MAITSYNCSKAYRRLYNRRLFRKNRGNLQFDPADPDNADKICTRHAFQRAKVNVPVAVKPFSFAGPAKTFCESDPVLKKIRWKRRCQEEICYFTFSQEICVEIPIHFGAKARAGKPWVDCHEAWAEDCGDCD